ncbi:type I 3-dehydroquinate dehydratase, partial [Chloroflexota bacterium]
RFCRIVMNKPRICAVIVNNDLVAIKNIEPSVDLFEVRIDLIGDDWQKLVNQLNKPWIATNRTIAEGGKWQGNEGRRIEYLLQAIELGAGIVDIELETKNLDNIIPLIKKRANCILSFHDLEKTPPLDEMKNIVQRQLEAGADICKFVSTAQGIEDNIAILELISAFEENKTVAFAMGQAGQFSRVFSPLVGAHFTYASIERGKESAPGQIAVEEFLKIYGMLKGNLQNDIR